VISDGRGPHTIAAIMVEGITGSNGLFGASGRLLSQAASAFATKYGILLIDDEVDGRISGAPEKMAGHAALRHQAGHRYVRKKA